MKIVKIKAFNFLELNDEAKIRVIHWLDELPFEYEDEDGNIVTQHFYELDHNDIQEHCSINDYLFDVHGNAIHHLILEIEMEI